MRGNGRVAMTPPTTKWTLADALDAAAFLLAILAIVWVGGCL